MAQDTFAFHSQQSVYIVAVRGNYGFPWMTTLQSSKWNYDLPVEKEIRNGFEKRRIFNITSSPSTADFVFLCVTDYYDRDSRLLLGVFAVVLKPSDFTVDHSQLARMLAPTKVRDVALWQQTKLYEDRKRIKLNLLTDDFHEFALNK